MVNRKSSDEGSAAHPYMGGGIGNQEEEGNGWQQINVLGEPIQPCSHDPLTGFYRSGCCETGDDDRGVHTICVIATEEFLEFSKSVGNDLSTPMPHFNFQGLKPGNQWCLCALRWVQALKMGAAPKVVLKSTHMRTLNYVSLDILKQYAIDWKDK